MSRLGKLSSLIGIFVATVVAVCVQAILIEVYVVNVRSILITLLAVVAGAILSELVLKKKKIISD